MQTEEYLDITQLTKRIPFSKTTVKDLIAKKALREGIHFSKPTGPSGKKVFFWSAIQSWIKQRDVILKADYARKNFRRSLVP